MNDEFEERFVNFARAYLMVWDLIFRPTSPPLEIQNPITLKETEMDKKEAALSWGEFKRLVDEKLERLNLGDDIEIGHIEIYPEGLDDFWMWYTIEVTESGLLIVG